MNGRDLISGRLSTTRPTLLAVLVGVEPGAGGGGAVPCKGPSDGMAHC